MSDPAVGGVRSISAIFLQAVYGGMAFGILVGWLVEHHGYAPAFAIAGVMHPLAFGVILLSVRRVGPLGRAEVIAG